MRTYHFSKLQNDETTLHEMYVASMQKESTLHKNVN